MSIAPSAAPLLAERFGGPVIACLVSNMTYIEHAHTLYELLYVLDGSLRMTVNSKRVCVNKDDLIFIGSNVIHSIIPENNALVLVIACDPLEVPRFSKLFGESGLSALLLRNEGENVAPRDIIRSLLNDHNTRTNAIALTGYVDLILSRLTVELQNFEGQAHYELTAIDKALIYVGNTMPAPIQLEQTARAAGMSKYHFSRIFNEQLGISLSSYAALMRVNAARRILAQTNLPVHDVYARCGYTNLRGMNRDFLRFVGCTPRDYRQKLPEQRIIDYSTPEIEALLRKRW